MSSVTFSSPPLQMSVVEGHLKQLRTLYHRIEAAPSIHPKEKEIRDILRRISTDVNAWAKEQVSMEVWDRISRLKKTFYQVEDRLELRLKDPVPPHAESAEFLLETIDGRLAQTRRLYHRIQAHEDIEKEEINIRQELSEISQEMQKLKKLRPDKREDDVADKIKRLKITLYEVEDFLKENIGSSFYNAVVLQHEKLNRMKMTTVKSSLKEIIAELERLRKRAESIGTHRSLIKVAAILIDSQISYFSQLVTVKNSGIGSSLNLP
jgi:hypothetical protein